MADPSALPQPGRPAPDFRLASSTGEEISLDQFRDKKIIVLYFYPKADTPGCTKEACGFRDALADYDKSSVAVLGISPDPVAAVRQFAEKYRLNFPLLADEEHQVAEKYGVWQQKHMMGREYMGAVRTTFVIDRDGRVLHVFEKVKPEGHDQQVLTWLRENGLAAAQPRGS